MNKLKMTRLCLAMAATFCLGHAWAATEADAAKLGKELTPAGGEKAANKDGSIPAWVGAEAPAAGWAYGKKRVDFWKHKSEKPLFTIDASNVAKYADKLSPGQVAMVKQIKGYQMDVYPTHRSCGVPDFVADNTKKNVGKTHLSPDGWSLKEATVPGYPFPIPANGAEAMWNAKLRYRGLGVDMPSVITAVSPRKGSSEWIKAASEQTLYYPWGAKGSNNLSKVGNGVEYYTYFTYNAPAALAGQALAITNFLDQPASETFYYFPGQRRVRRMPSYAYDSPQIGMENQYTLDEPMVFNGPIDRFDWKIVGKKEMYVSYNAFGAFDFDKKFEDIAKNEFIDPSHRRYELHRVLVVEATVKAGTRHAAPKRTFYLDEDSWNLVGADDYDAQGKIWKVREGYLIPVYETGTCDVTAFSQYNLAEGRYVFDMHAVGTGKDQRWNVEANGPRYKSSFYTSENLRSISDR
ncbi:MAG TPA: DUF1329 domain-containing protein [Rhodocyclaceae bacterium]|nr:DUF1329 domain-containing protein [Rhodocyclaceae bacterium]